MWDTRNLARPLTEHAPEVGSGVLSLATLRTQLPYSLPAMYNGLHLLQRDTAFSKYDVISPLVMRQECLHNTQTGMAFVQ